VGLGDGWAHDIVGWAVWERFRGLCYAESTRDRQGCRSLRKKHYCVNTEGSSNLTFVWLRSVLRSSPTRYDYVNGYKGPLLCGQSATVWQPEKSCGWRVSRQRFAVFETGTGAGGIGVKVSLRGNKEGGALMGRW